MPSEQLARPRTRPRSELEPTGRVGRFPRSTHPARVHAEKVPEKMTTPIPPVEQAVRDFLGSFKHGTRAASARDLAPRIVSLHPQFDLKEVETTIRQGYRDHWIAKKQVDDSQSTYTLA